VVRTAGSWSTFHAAIAVGLDELALRQRDASFLALDGPVAQHRVRKVDIELVRRHIGALRHEAHVAQGAGVGDLPVVGRRHRIELAAFRIVDQVEQARERIAQIEAAATGVADVEDAVHLGFGFRPVGKVRIFPRDRMRVGASRLPSFIADLFAWRGRKKGAQSRCSRPPFGLWR
jgi:hypothetical protein